MNNSGVKFRLPALAALLAAALLGGVFLAAGCGGQEKGAATLTQPATTGTVPGYRRLQPDYYRGIDEPRPDAWQTLVDDVRSLKGDGFNTAAVQPPVLISDRGGQIQRVILEGEEASAVSTIDQLHQASLAVLLSPTTKSPDLKPQVDTSGAVLGRLDDDTLKWAQTAEEHQVELFAPLWDYNLVLGPAADKWSANILPRIKEKYHGALAARVVPDLGAPPPAGTPHDFESLNYKGYDYLMLDVFPQGDSFDMEVFDTYVDDLMNRAEAVVQRDNLRGVIIEFGGWRAASGSETINGPLLGRDGQAALAANLMPRLLPRTRGLFFNGWTLPGRGAKGYPVEDVLRQYFGGPGLPAPAPATRTSTSTQKAPVS